MKFKITNKAVEWLKVEYEDGSFAQIPSVKGLTKTDWHHTINAYAPKGAVETLEEIPWNIGDEGDTDTDLTPEPTFSYESARWALYPTVETQLLALYESRKGSNVALEAVDKTITDVNTLIPIDDTKVYTETEVDAIKVQLQQESA